MSTSFKGATIAVVGGAGFVGSNLVKMLLREEPRRIVVIDNPDRLQAAGLNRTPDAPHSRRCSGRSIDAATSSVRSASAPGSTRRDG